MSFANLNDPVFIAKVVDFIVFVIAIVWVFERYLKVQLANVQEAQNKTVEDAIAQRIASAAALEAAKLAVEKARVDAVRMVELGSGQAARLLSDERAAAEDHAKRILAHASGEFERERYRVRRELFEDTVEKAHAEAKALVRRELSPAQQQALVGQLVAVLERTGGK